MTSIQRSLALPSNILLHEAVRTGDYERMKHLVNDVECDCTEISHLGASVLHLACSEAAWEDVDHMTDIVHTLLDRGCAALLNRHDVSGRTPLHTAILQELEDYVQLLLDSGADPNIATLDQFGDSPMHVAVDARCLTIMEMLLKAGARLNYKTEKNKLSVLGAALENGYVLCAKYIVSQGCDLLQDIHRFNPESDPHQQIGHEFLRELKEMASHPPELWILCIQALRSVCNQNKRLVASLKHLNLPSVLFQQLNFEKSILPIDYGINENPSVTEDGIQYTW